MRGGDGFTFAAHDPIVRLREAESLDERLEAFAIFRAVDGVRRCSDNGHTRRV